MGNAGLLLSVRTFSFFVFAETMVQFLYSSVGFIFRRLGKRLGVVIVLHSCSCIYTFWIAKARLHLNIIRLRQRNKNNKTYFVDGEMFANVIIVNNGNLNDFKIYYISKNVHKFYIYGPMLLCAKKTAD